MIQALKKANIVDDQQVEEAKERNEAREQLFDQLMKEAEAATLAFDIAKKEKRATARALVDVVPKAERFIEQDVRVGYWKDVLTTHIKKDQMADERLGRARSRCAKVKEELEKAQKL